MSKMKEKIVSLKEFRLNTQKYIDDLDKGASFLVMKRSTPVFKLIPVDEEEMRETVVDFTKIKKTVFL